MKPTIEELKRHYDFHFLTFEQFMELVEEYLNPLNNG